MESVFSLLDSSGSSFHRQWSTNSVTRFSDTSSSDFGSNEFLSAKCETVFTRSVSYTVQNCGGLLDVTKDMVGRTGLGSSINNLSSLAPSESMLNPETEYDMTRRLQSSRKTWAFFPRAVCPKCRDFATGVSNQTVCFCEEKGLNKHRDEPWRAIRNKDIAGHLELRANNNTESDEAGEEEEDDDDEDSDESEEENSSSENDDDKEDYIVEEADDSDTASSSSLSSDDDERSCAEVEELPPDSVEELPPY